MADEKDQKQKASDLEQIRSNQQILKNQLKQLEEGISTPKVYSFQTEEIREMVQTLLKQNKHLAEKVDYLLSILVEASTDISDDVFDKTLAAMGKSQLDMIDQLAAVREKIEAGQAKVEELDNLYKATEEKLKAISDSISQLSYAKQLEDMKSNISAISADVQKLGGVVTSETPALKENIESLRKELAELKGKLADMSLFREDIKEIETELSNVESMLSKKETKTVAELSQEDRQKIQEISEKLFDLNTEVKKLEKAFESYPSSEAQGTTALREKLDEIETVVSSLKHEPTQESVAKELESLRAKINSIEKMFEQKELDMEKKREAEMELISNLLRKIEGELETLRGQEATQLSQVLTDLSEKARQIAETVKGASVEKPGPTYFDSLKSEVDSLGARLARIEDYVKKERVAESSHINDIQTEIKAIRKELENIRGMSVKPEVLSKVKKDISTMQIPAAKVIQPEEKQKITAIKTSLKASSEALEPVQTKEVAEVKKGLKSAEERVSGILKEIGKTEQDIIEKRETVKRLRGEVLGAPMRNEDILSSYISRLPLHEQVKVGDLAIILAIDPKEAVRLLLKMQKDNPNRISVRNTGYLSKLMGREPVVIRLQ
jgi:DNA repair exonuclease SbcCD ATPase subunit